MICLRPVSALLALLCALIQGCVTAPEPVPPAPPPPLPDGNWEIVAASFAQTGRVPGAPRATLTIRDGMLLAFTGCNTANGAVRRVAGRLDMPKVSVTRRACPEPLGWFESRLFGLLKASPLYQFDGDVLTLTSGNNNASFRRAPVGQPAGR